MIIDTINLQDFKKAVSQKEYEQLMESRRVYENASKSIGVNYVLKNK